MFFLVARGCRRWFEMSPSAHRPILGFLMVPPAGKSPSRRRSASIHWLLVDGPFQARKDRLAEDLTRWPIALSRAFSAYSDLCPRRSRRAPGRECRPSTDYLPSGVDIDDERLSYMCLVGRNLVRRSCSRRHDGNADRRRRARQGVTRRLSLCRPGTLFPAALDMPWTVSLSSERYEPGIAAILVARPGRSFVRADPEARYSASHAGSAVLVGPQKRI